MTREQEFFVTLGISAVPLLVVAVLMGRGDFLPVLMFYGGPSLVFLVIAAYGPKIYLPGWTFASSLGFVAVAVFEVLWELYIYQRPNSMPGFAYLFFCVPLACVGFALAACTVRRAHARFRTLTLISCGLLVFLLGSVPMLFSMA